MPKRRYCSVSKKEPVTGVRSTYALPKAINLEITWRSFVEGGEGISDRSTRSKDSTMYVYPIHVVQFMNKKEEGKTKLHSFLKISISSINSI